MMRFSVGTGAMGMGKRMDKAATESSRVGGGQSRRFSAVTIAHYDRLAHAFWDGTRDHDVSQNDAALLDAIEGDPPYSILDLRCGPGRDLCHFRALEHDEIGRASCRERVWQYGEISVGAGILKKNKNKRVTI